ncbi:T9SS type A sorting domain-containing protein [bacterium]|jgi:hypothetical protein|nr:T9SS type A sorting domain-containing protein [Balneola sp.]MBR9916439.1 T9SS type A sorting domain-containing protein [bacterium]
MKKLLPVKATLLFFLLSSSLFAQDLRWVSSAGYDSLGFTGTFSSLSKIMVVNERLFVTINKSSNFDQFLYSDDNGVNWQESGLSPAIFFPVVLASGQSDSMYAYGLTTSFALGIAKSTDLGENWEAIPIQAGVSGNFEFFVHNSGDLLMAGRSADIILSKDGGENWVKKNSINENDQVENIRNLFSFGDYFFAHGRNSNSTSEKGLYRMHKEDSTWVFLGDTTNVKDDNNYFHDNDIVYDEENQRMIMLWENPFQSGGDDDDIMLAYSDNFGENWIYKTKADIGDPIESGEYEELAIKGEKLMIIVKDGVQTGGNRVIAVDKELSGSGYVNTTADFEGTEDEKRIRLLKANSTAAFGYRELRDPYRKMLFTYPEQTGSTVSNEEEGATPEQFTLEQNYPNPFNPSTNISFNLPQASDVSLKVYNMLGQEVATLVNERLGAGTQTVNFDASDLSSGMYIYRIQAGTFSQTKKMMLIK